jgi:hypothetical protein
VISTVKQIISRIPTWARQGKTILFREGPVGLIRRGWRKMYRFLLYSGDPHRMHRFNYGDWMKNIEARYLNDEYMDRLAKKIKKETKFSIIMPVWNKPVDMIEKALNSILNQRYDNWEICISDGSSENIE